jgi:hypothetical protein
VKDLVRIGCWAAFWGDTPRAAEQILTVPDLDYMVGDHLAEITMALLARARAKDPEAGYVPDSVGVLAKILPTLAERGIKVVTNGGALNPAAAAQALRDAVEQAGLSLRVAAVEGDDVLPMGEALLAAHPGDLFTGVPIPAGLSTMNAYLGATPIARALDAGADIVVTGRCVDAAVVLGPLLHEFGWSEADYDLLSAGSLVGHIVECGPQCTGGLHTDWWAVPGWENMGYPVAEVRRDGTAVITKPEGTGGLVTPATVSEQILYEIGDPGAYVMPDVVCDWREVCLEQAGPERVAVSGARGSAPTRSYKVCATHQDGYRVIATALFAGLDAAGRARRAGEAMVARSGALIAAAGHEPLGDVSVEVVGAGDLVGDAFRPDTAAEAVLKIGLRHPRREALELFAGEFAPLALVAMGMTGGFAGRPRVAPVFAVYHLLADKTRVPVTVALEGETTTVPIAPGERDAPSASPELPRGGADAPGRGESVPLRRIAYGRSGDKGDKANVGLIARHPELAAVIRDQVTPERVAAFFAHYDCGEVRGWELPGLHAFNFVIDAVLGGTGGTSTLRYDAQGKSYAAMLLGVPVVVPAEWDRLLPD